MKTPVIGIFIGLLLAVTGSAQARDTHHEFSIQEVMERSDAAGILGDMKFYFGKQSHAAVKESFGEYQSNRKTNAFGKSDKEACQWAMLSALKSLKERAESLGGDAVINIRSNYKNDEFVSETGFRCGAGALMAGVALKGEVVRIGR